MRWSKVRQLANLQSLFAAVASGCLGLWLASVDESLRNNGWWSYLLIAGVAIGAIGFIVIRMRQREAVETIIHSPRLLVTSREKQFYARKGLIAFVGLYKPNDGSLGAQLGVDEQRKAAEKLEFDKLSLDRSNLRTVVSAIVNHQERLEHCWLISSAGEEGSYVFAKMLAAYLKQEKGLTCQFHYEANKYAIELEPEAVVLQKTYDVVDNIFESQILPAKEMVADITTAPRSMSLGMILASLDKERDLEFMGTKYDRSGQPVGDLIPMIYSFEPKIKVD